MEHESTFHNEMEAEIAQFIQENLTREQLDTIAYKIGEIFAVIREVPGGQELLEKSISGVPEWLFLQPSQ